MGSWDSSAGEIPVGCSVRETSVKIGGKVSPAKAHFNSAESGAGRSDLAPICHAQSPTPEPTPEPTPVPTCCSDEATPWMISNGYTCGSPQGSLEELCKKGAWQKNKYCQQSCFEAGQGYDGDSCVVTQCSNTVTPWMMRNGYTCESPHDSLEELCAKSCWRRTSIASR